MNFTRLPETFIASVLLAAGAASGLSAQEIAPGYLFLGSEPSARSGKSFFPIVAMDKKKIYVDEGTKIRKVSPNAPCRTRIKTKVSDRFVEVLELDFGTSSMSNLQRSSDAVADMQMAESQSEAKIALIQQGGGGGSAQDQDNQINELKRSGSEFQERMKKDLDDGNFELDELADTIYVKGEFLPKTDVPGAYCIVVVTSQRQDFTTREYIGKSQSVRAKYLGDLTKDQIYKLKVRCAVNEFNLRMAEYQLHLFSETGEQVAMSTSRALKALTDEEFRKFQESLGKSRAKKSS